MRKISLGRWIRILSGSIKQITELIDASLLDLFDIDNKYQKEVVESMKYSLFSGGKRLRPIFAIKTFNMFDNGLEKILPYALAIEMIHTYSLIHDDLPAMDNDDFRRGRASNHKVYGEAMAILAGDGLLNYAFETMLNDISNSRLKEVDRLKRISAAKLISKSSGIRGMIGGQVVDISDDFKDMDDKKLLFMYESKTAALFKASIVSGAIIGGASQKEIDILDEYSNLLGLSYQIQDDLIDIEVDYKSSKLTYLSFYDIKKAKRDLNNLTKRCYELLDLLENRETLFLEKLTKMLINRKK